MDDDFYNSSPNVIQTHSSSMYLVDQNRDSFYQQRVDHRERTSDVIYEKYRQKHLEGKIRSRIVFGISTFLAISAITAIGLMQYDEYFAFLNDRYDYINATHAFCNVVELNDIDIISTPIAAFLILIYILLYRRRVFLRNKFKYRNVGCPMMVSCWNKTDRLLSSFTYGLIAYNVFCIVRNTLNGQSNSKNLIKVKDPTALLSLLFKIAEMFMIGIRYYPILVAFRVNSFIINVTSAIYMWIDFIEALYQYGKCGSVAAEFTESDEETERRFGIFMAYKVLSAVPLCIFFSFIVVTLTYKSIINLIDFILRYRTLETKLKMMESSKDSWGFLIMAVDDEHEILYSRYDIDYVLNLLNNPDDGNENSKKQKSKTKPEYNKKYLRLAKGKRSLPAKLFAKIVYDWNPTFRFTSRFCNTMTVAIVALYYFFLYFGYIIVVKLTYWVSQIPESLDTGTLDLNIGERLCALNEALCLEQLQEIGTISLPIPKKFVTISTQIRSSLLAVFIVPLFGALIICLVQMLFLSQDIRKHLIELYKGQCEFVTKAKNLSNPSIASASFHFGG